MTALFGALAAGPGLRKHSGTREDSPSAWPRSTRRPSLFRQVRQRQRRRARITVGYAAALTAVAMTALVAGCLTATSMTLASAIARDLGYLGTVAGIGLC